MRVFGQFLWLSMVLIVVMLTISFATSNNASVTLYLWPLEGGLTAPTWLTILSSFIFGGLFSIALLWAQSLAIRAKIWNLQAKLNKLQSNAVTQRNKKDSDFSS